MDVVDLADPEAHAAWFRAKTRGFLRPAPAPEAVEEQRHRWAEDVRLVGVHDATAAMPHEPVATSSCWPTDLTVPGGRAVPAWAITGITVSPTHRRRGIARHLVEAELRAARALELPVAILTVSESTIYSRFGFAPGAFGRDLTINRRRVRWTGPTPAGRVHAVSAEQLREDGLPVVERVRRGRPGELRYSEHQWNRQFGVGLPDEEVRKLRFLRYDDADGTAQGFAIVEIAEDTATFPDFTENTLRLHSLVAATTDAYAALWRHLLEMDLIATITAHLRPVDEPLRWMIDDFRAVKVDEYDHLWVRVVDVPAALSARTFARSGRLVLAVDDPLGFADGTWVLDVDADGLATVAASSDRADVTLTAAALGALYLGGVRASTLAAAGTLTGDAAAVDALFASPVAPHLSIWF